jgi:integrase/recombinase XerD
MEGELVVVTPRVGTRSGFDSLPALITDAGERARTRFLEFFTAAIRNKNTRAAYVRAVGQFCDWCERRGLRLESVTPVAVAAYIEQHSASKPTVKQHLAAIRMLFDYLVTGGVLPFNPAASVKGPKYG